MRLETTSCPLCRAGRHELVYETRDWLREQDPLSYRVVRCAECSLRFVNPRPAAAELPRLYSPDYYAVSIEPAELLRRRERINREKAALVERHSSRGRLLDLGCQRGDFLEHMRRRGWQVQGVELSDAVPALPGLEIRHGPLSAARFPAGSFDVVTLWSVVEHLPDPGEQLDELARILRPGGTLVLLTTNYESIPSALLKLEDVPRHLVLFTRSTLRQLLARHGFVVTRLACTDRISRNSANGLLQFLLARARGRQALERFYRRHFANSFAEPRSTTQSWQRLRRMGLANALLVATDRSLAKLLDGASLLLGSYGTILAIARKPDDASARLAGSAPR